jgi:hypothetical protein
VDPLVSQLLLKVAAAPDDPGPRGVLADVLCERDEAWGAWMQAERFGEQGKDPSLFQAAMPRVSEALGLGPSWDGIKTWLGLPTAVTLTTGMRMPDTSFPAWALVERLRFGERHAQAPALLKRGFDTHGWPRLRLVGGLTADALWQTRPWGAGRFAGVALQRTTTALEPEDLLQFLVPRPEQLTLDGAWQVSAMRRSDTCDVWVTCEPGMVGEQRLERLLTPLLQRMVQPGDELVFSYGGYRLPAFVETLLPTLPPHEFRLRER